MDYSKQKKHWIESSIDDLYSSESIFNNGNYDWSLFIGHLSLEKILKAYFIYKKKEIPLKTHKLDKLAEVSDLILSDEQYQFFIKVNEFNLEARYPDYKTKFKEICTKEFARKYLILIKEMHKWILDQIK
jgi:HEPN domain-containing protein